jgi:hypothetical protein
MSPVSFGEKGSLNQRSYRLAAASGKPKIQIENML